MLPFALASFLGAFLLFAVQPLLGRYVLPTFGGAPAIWSVCLVFFQTALLAGYLYAHALTQLKSQRHQVLIHGLLFAIALLFLPPIPATASLTGASDSVVWRALGLLIQTIGLPFTIMAATGPLIQSWFSRSFPQRSPYRLFALSNAGSLLGLLTYPILIEPHFDRATQAWGWSAGFGLLAAVLLKSGFSRANNSPPENSLAPTEPISLARRLIWIGWAAIGSALLVATTNAMTHDVAGVPFLWIAPLTVYLLTFIVAFDHPRWYHRPTLSAALVVASVVIIDAAAASGIGSFLQLSAAYLVALFVAGLVCHGELYRSRPQSSHLTIFYLHIATGGAVGSLCVAVVAPAVFDRFVELPFLWTAVIGWFAYGIFRTQNVRLARGFGFGIVICPVFLVLFRTIDALFFGHATWTDFWENFRHTLSSLVIWPVIGIGAGLVWALGDIRTGIVRRWHRRVILLVIAVPMAVLAGWWKFGLQHDPAAIFVARNTFGTITVSDFNTDQPRAQVRYLSHGSTTHGIQLMHPDYQSWPTTYYGPESGIGLALAQSNQSAGRKIGVVGLGVGTVASYGQTGDHVRFYELDPAMVDVAQTQFTALARSAATITIKVGDGRLLLAAENSDASLPRLDVLVIDAFSSDAVPIHLLTSEAFAIYLDRLKSDGILIVNVSNRWVDVRSVVLAQAQKLGLTAASIFHRPSPDDWWAFASEWVLLTRLPARFESAAIQAAATPRVEIPPPSTAPAWTDDFAGLWSALR